MYVNFDEVSVFAKKTAKCPSCGKRTTRSQRFWQTLNPFNKNSDGTPKSRREIIEELRVEAEDWKPDFRHNTEKCRG